MGANERLGERAGGPPFLVGAAPEPPAPRLVRAIDVSSHQPTDLTEIIRKTQAEHVIVKLYLPGEDIPQEHSLAQIASAKVNGCSVGGYFWLYRSFDACQSVRDVLALARRAELQLSRLAIDYEPYVDGSIPTIEQLWQAVDECQMQGIQPIIYTGVWCWPPTQEFADYPLWVAEYDGEPTLDFKPFGGWNKCVAKQYLVDGTTFAPMKIDLDVVSAEATE